MATEDEDLVLWIYIYIYLYIHYSANIMCFFTMSDNGRSECFYSDLKKCQNLDAQDKKIHRKDIFRKHYNESKCFQLKTVDPRVWKTTIPNVLVFTNSHEHFSVTQELTAVNITLHCDIMFSALFTWIFEWNSGVDSSKHYITLWQNVFSLIHMNILVKLWSWQQ